MRKLNRRNINTLLRFLRQRGYKIFERPYELNIIGIRTDNKRPNKFDDFIYVIYKIPDGNWVGFEFPATTDTGTYYLNNPIHPKGTAMLKSGQYVNAYRIGKHRGIYDALVQVKPVTVIRNPNRDGILNFNTGIKDTGLFGINIHRASSSGTTKYIDKHSAGCQVFANADDYDLFMNMVERQRELYGNNFTYTLIDQREFMDRIRRNIVITGALAITITTILLVSFSLKSTKK